MQVAVNITPETMNWIIHNAKMDAITPSMADKIEQWKSGDKVPTFNQIETLSKVINIPLGYFFLKIPPEENVELLEYRTVQSDGIGNKPSRNLIDTIHDMERIQDWMRNFLITNDDIPMPFVGSAKTEENVYKIASHIRDVMGLKENWMEGSKKARDSFGEIRKLAENLGVLVMLNGIVGNNTHRKLEIEEFRAFTLVDKYAPLIFINSNDSENGKLFSLLHELTHIWLGKSSLYNDRYNTETNVSNTEILCNKVAAEFLVPNNMFVSLWNNQPEHIDHYKKIEKIEKYFKCGMTVIARKALDKKFINWEQYTIIAEDMIKLYNEWQKNKKGSESGGDYYNNLAVKIDHRFLNTIADSAQEGKISYTEVFRLTGTNRRTFDILIGKVRGEIV